MTAKRLDLSQIHIVDASTAITPQALLHGFKENGVVLLRGGRPNLPWFEAVTHALCDRFHNAGTRYKDRVGGDPFTTRAFTVNCALLAHVEGAYAPHPEGKPDAAFFLCDVPPPEEGGETTVFDGAMFLEHLPPAWRERFAAGIIYEKRWAKERWQGEFLVDTEAELMRFLDGFPNVRYSVKDGELHFLHAAPAITRSHSGHEVFATGMLAHLPRITHPRYVNQNILTSPHNGIYFADGERVSDDIINGLIDRYDELHYAHRWQKGDVLILDNSRFMHGRTMTARDCERVIITRFGWLK